MAKSLAELGLDINDLEIVPDPHFETPYEFLVYYAPQQDWSAAQIFTWEDAHKVLGLQALLTDVGARHTRPLIMRKKV